jgi:hypothetical protein
MAGIIIRGKEIQFPGPVKQVMGEMAVSKRAVDPTIVVMHVDCTYNTKSAQSVLEHRDLSTHFGIDGDEGHGGYATLWQFADPGLDVCFHAGSKANRISIGLDMNSPLDMDHQEADLKKRGRSRPVAKATVRGKIRTNLGFFPEQIATLRAVAEIFKLYFNIPVAWPRDHRGVPISDVWKDYRTFHGWVGHYMIPETTHYCPGSAGLTIVDSVFPRKIQPVD